jgi:rhamnosyltransferase
MLGKKPNFAIFLAVKNGMPWLPFQIKSIQDQKYINYKLFINLDKSKDNSYFFLKKIQNNKIKIFKSRNSIGSPSKNFFWMIKNINFSKFDYLAFSDQDDIWHNKKLFYAHNEIKKKNFEGYSSNLIAFGNIKKNFFVKKNYAERKFDYLFESASAGCTFVLKRKSALQLKYFLIKYWKKILKINNYDWFIYAFFRHNNFKWFFDKRYTVNYRQHSNNFLGANISFGSYKKRLNLIFSGWYDKEVKKIYDLLLNISKKKMINVYSKIEIIKNINHTRRNMLDRFFLLIFIIFFIY